MTTQPETFVLTSSLVENDPRYGDTYNLGYQNFYVARLGPKGDAKPYLFAQRHDYAVTVVDAGGRPVAVVGTALNVEANAARGRRGKSCADPWERVDVYRCSPGQDKRAKFPTSKAPFSAVFHSFRLIFGRAIISRNGLEA